MRLACNAFILCLAATCACAAPERLRFRIDMQTQTDDGQGLAGVRVWHGEQNLGLTTTSARIEVDVEAVAGSSFEVRFECPTGYSATRDRVLVPLRTASKVAAKDVPEATKKQTADSSYSGSTYALTLECRPQKRSAVVVVHSNMANVPIKIGNEVKGKTNAEGIAYLALNFPPKEIFEISLDTGANPFLRPVNPEFPFVMPDHDEIFVLQEDFRIEEPPPPPPVQKKKKPKRVAPLIEKPTRPVKIKAGKDQWGSVK